MQSRHFITVQSRGQMILPADLRRRLHLNEAGAQVEVVERADGVIELHPHVAVPAADAWFWDKNWQEGEKAVDEHIRQGRVAVSDSPDAFFEDLAATRGTSRTKRRS